MTPLLANAWITLLVPLATDKTPALENGLATVPMAENVPPTPLTSIEGDEPVIVPPFRLRAP